MAYNFDDETSARRIAAYNSFLLAAYDTDADGLAEIADVDSDDMAEYLAETDYDNISVAVLQKLGNLTGISFGWLFAEQQDGAAAQTASAGRAPAIDYDDFREATVKVKAAAAVMAALYNQSDAGRLTYDTELFDVLSAQLHEAARYLDGVLETL